MYKVLIVDDERMIREGLKSSIDWQKLMFSDVYLAKDGIEGQDMILQYEPDLVITDIKMPRMNGIEMMEATRQIDYEKLILSSYDDFEYAKAAIQFKVVDYLLKPIDEDELNTLLQTIVRTFKATKRTVPEILRPVLMTDFDNY
ncbi:MAG: response regulator, partial [Macrococcoides caseolyticum]